MQYKKTLLSQISNYCLLLIVITILSFIWINYYVRNLKISLVSSIIILITFCIIYFPTISIFNSKNFKKKERLKKITQLKNELIFGSALDNAKIISKYLNIELIPTKNPNHYKHNNQDVFIAFEKNIITEEDIIKILKSRTSNNITIYCIEKDYNINIESINLNIITIDKIQSFIIKDNKFTSMYQPKKSAKFTAKDYICIILNKNRSKSYFGFGLLLIISSLFTIYHIYYIIMGTILLILSIFSRFNIFFNKV